MLSINKVQKSSFYQRKGKIVVRTKKLKKLRFCDSCEFKTFKNSSLILHMRKHTGEKPFSCNLCSMKFSFKSNLLRHKRVYIIEKPISCELCSYKCHDKTGLVKHMRANETHKEKPFSCDRCSSTYSLKESLIYHMKVHIKYLTWMGLEPWHSGL